MQEGATTATTTAATSEEKKFFVVKGNSCPLLSQVPTEENENVAIRELQRGTILIAETNTSEQNFVKVKIHHEAITEQQINEGYVEFSKKNNNIAPLSMDRYAKVKKCPVYSKIIEVLPTKNNMLKSASSSSEESTSSSAATTTTSSSSSSIEEAVIQYIEKGEKVATLCDYENGEWFKVIMPDMKTIGYVQSYMTGKVSAIQKLHYKYSNDELLKSVEEEAAEEKTQQAGSQNDGTFSSFYNEKSNTYHFNFTSIGVFESCFPDKNGTPRQGNLVPSSRGRLVMTVPSAEHALDSLEQFSHVWLIFVFHKNTAVSNAMNHPKIRPPRLNGAKVGLFSTRTPHRPNPIGLSVAKIDKIEKNIVHLSGVDLVDGTPVIDIKPYIPFYDSLGGSHAQLNTKVVIPQWVDEAPKPRIDASKITFTEEADNNLKALCPRLDFFTNDFEGAKKAIIEVIQTDPRPTYVRKKNKEKLYGFRIDNINIRCCIDNDDNVQVVIIEKWEE